jgi:tetratricopeptide (TPR) repeat protein
LSGNFAKGTEVFENAMITQKELLGEDHPRLAASIFNLGMIKRILHKHEEAMSHFQIALQIQFLSIQKHHPDTMNTQMEIGITKLEMSKIDEAMEEFKSLLQTQVEILGHIHPDVALTHHYMGICHFKNNDIQKASKKLDRSFRIRQKLKMDCPKVANLLEDMGLLHMRKGRLDKAFNALMDSLRIRRDCLGEDHYELSYSAFNLGRLSFEKRDFAQALLYFKEAMRIALRSFGLHHPFIGDIHLYVGHVQQRKCHFHEAKSEIALAIQIYESSNLSSSHKKIMDAKNDLLQVEREEELCV